MSSPRYPKYKPSGVEWLGDVPDHWTAGRLRRFARRYSGGTPDKTNLAYWQDGEIPWLNSGAVNDRLISEPSTFITTEALANSSAKWVPAGALVMALAGQGKTKGMVAQLAIPSTCNQSMAAIVPNANLHARFLLWWLDSNYQSIRNLAGGDLRDGLNLELVGNIPVPVLPLPEQTAIAEFLDRETGKIDGLVAEQRRLMELLKEKRQAVISHAVTKGLNPHATMKPSGIEWLGDVPEHWGMRTLAKVSTKITNGFVGPTRDILVPSGTPYIQSTHIKKGRVNFDEGYFVSPEWSESHSKSILAEGDVLIVQTGGIGDVGLVSANEAGFNCHALIIVASVKDLLSGAFLAAVFQSEYGRQKLVSIRTGGMHPHLNCGNVKYIDIPLPPLAEQSAILKFVEAELAKFDTLTAEAQRAIDLLQERRTALISAAVTGQIDVRQQPRN